MVSDRNILRMIQYAMKYGRVDPYDVLKLAQAELAKQKSTQLSLGLSEEKGKAHANSISG